jgi:hypothetical protein
MWMKNKTFDCVEMKNRIQAEIYAEYLAHKDEYATYLDFINARVEKSEFAQRMIARFPLSETSSGAHAPLERPEQ